MFNVCCETCCRSLSSRSGWTWPWSRKTCFEQAPCCAEACNVTCVPVSDRSSLGLECVLASRALARPWLSLTSQTCEASYKNAVGYWLLLTVLAIACSACCCFHLLSPSPAMRSWRTACSNIALSTPRMLWRGSPAPGVTSCLQNF